MRASVRAHIRMQCVFMCERVCVGTFVPRITGGLWQGTWAWLAGYEHWPRVGWTFPCAVLLLTSPVAALLTAMHVFLHIPTMAHPPNPPPTPAQVCIDALGVLKQQQATTAERHMAQAANTQRQVAQLSEGLARVQLQLQQQKGPQWQQPAGGGHHEDGIKGSNGALAAQNGTAPDPWLKG